MGGVCVGGGVGVWVWGRMYKLWVGLWWGGGLCGWGGCGGLVIFAKDGRLARRSGSPRSTGSYAAKRDAEVPSSSASLSSRTRAPFKQ
jgi:hypothetical protein